MFGRKRTAIEAESIRVGSIRGQHPTLFLVDEDMHYGRPATDFPTPPALPELSNGRRNIGLPFFALELKSDGVSHRTVKRMERARNGYGGYINRTKAITRRHLAFHGKFR